MKQVTMDDEDHDSDALQEEKNTKHSFHVNAQASGSSNSNNLLPVDQRKANL